MKHLSTIGSALLILCLVLSLAVSASAEFSSAVTLGEKVGEVELSDLKDATFSVYGIIRREEDGKCSILDFKGVNRFGRAYDNVETIGPDLFAVTDYTLMPNATSVARSDGTVLFENAAIVRTNSNQRYLTVSYATDVVESRDRSFLFSYASDQRFDFRTQPGEGDTMYAGYSLVYDLQEGRFVENVRLDDAGDYLTFKDDNIFVSYAYGSGRENEFFRPDGSRIEVEKGISSVGRYFYARTENGGYRISDMDFNPITEVDFYPMGFYAGGTLFANQLEAGGYQVVRSDGTAISEVVFASIPREENGFLIGSNTEGMYAVLSFAGDEILSFGDRANSVMEGAKGFLNVTYENGNLAVLYPDGRLVQTKERMYKDFCSYVNENGKAEVFLLNDAEYAVLDGQVNPISPMTFDLRDANARYGLYSTADGTQLLPQEYGGFRYANGMIYAKTDSAWEIWPVSITVK